MVIRTFPPRVKRKKEPNILTWHPRWEGAYLKAFFGVILAILSAFVYVADPIFMINIAVNAVGIVMGNIIGHFVFYHTPICCPFIL